MALVGTLVFCTDCGNLLERAPAHKKITCDVCHTLNENKWPTVIKSSSKPDAFPSALRTRRFVQTIDQEALDTWPTTYEDCPACGNPELLFKEMQLRGADEGSTIFYRCPKCDHKYTSNN